MDEKRGIKDEGENKESFINMQHTCAAGSCVYTEGYTTESICLNWFPILNQKSENDFWHEIEFIEKGSNLFFQ